MVGTRGFALLRGVGEVVSVNVALRASSSPVDRPQPRPDTAHIAEKLIAVVGGLSLVVARIELEELGGEVPEHLSVVGSVFVSGVISIGGRARLVLVVAGEDGDVAVVARAESFAVGIDKDVAVDDGAPERGSHECAGEVLELRSVEDGVVAQRIIREKSVHGEIARFGDGGHVQRVGDEVDTLGLGSRPVTPTRGGAARDGIVGATSTTLRDDTGDEVPGERTPHHVERTRRTSRLTADDDLVRVTAEVGDVIVDPLQGELLVEQAVVAGGVVGGLSAEVGMGEETEGAETVVDCDDDDVLGGKAGTVVRWNRACTSGEAPTVDPEKDGEVLGSEVGGIVIGRGPDVQVETVLADVLAAGREDARSAVRLGTIGTEGAGVIDVGPSFWSRRRRPSARTSWWCSVWNTLVDCYVVSVS